jgi:hypothetical protein
VLLRGDFLVSLKTLLLCGLTPDHDVVFLRTLRRSARWRMVGRPCGQFHGDLSVARLVSTRLICGLSSARPIMMELRHARIASMARTFFGRTTSCASPHRAAVAAVSGGGVSPSGEKLRRAGACVRVCVLLRSGEE